MTTFKGCVPVAPDAVRVWRGFRKHDLQWTKFLAFLRHTMFPTEATWRPYFGLTCYVAGIHKEAADPMNVNGGFYDANVCVVPASEGDQLVRLQFLRRRLAVENGRAVSVPLT
jgi:hypothetical protein